ncbi:tetratricopeptide repeat protein [Aetokthonos hydrillicola Thurmond2011]|jgi:tetratricopeptide (TPR) repeat protein|uniref:Tetratricopeptide repeat protein n=1 Tax=Aetokthonos hydrillicola Thurmond2011 TaxID=2712845 RepID=A0AAP5IG90_9CYAN|nr:tetratricopeptide repeat protein [Aetokthonos hydrillicola]MBO3461194.1 tetratricopeptide repeat protein [Aetokthonos hydrillicola CCALA 1050]MBW4589752.1 tetratricopeptide repeat protein [Aetokthonos hydrillicola CCALA 1050]MDR9900247.1 tetratricopeptide repeat protein [Aetokthonos hydrillicola Thurmond2011]
MTNENWQGINFKDSSPTISNNTFNFEAAKQNPPNNLQFTGSTNFVGRQRELTLLRDRLQQKGAVAISAVAGMGGVGKTELAVQYIKQHEADYPGGICWLNARESNLAALVVQFAQLHMNLEVPQQDFRGRALSLTEQVEWCWQHWKPPEGLVLIVLDDVTDVKSCRQVLPKTNRFRVLMTTRLRRLDTNFVEISLDVLSKEDALKLLIAVLGEEDQRVEQESQTAENLCAWLGYLPLGLELVGRYLVEDPDLSLAEMLQRLKDQSLQDEALDQSEEQLQDTEMTAKRGVKAALELSWKELHYKTQRVGELLSLFALDVIPWKLVETIIQSRGWEKADVNEAKKQLFKLHLIQRLADKESAYKIHPLIREFLKVKLAASEQADVLKRGFVEVMVAIAQHIPNSITQELINSVQEAIPHLVEVAQNLTDAISDENLYWALTGLGRFYLGQGLYALAEPWLKQCVSVVQTRLGEDYPDAPNSYESLSLLYYSQGRYSDAELLSQKALQIYQRLLREDHPDVANCYNNLATLYCSQGRYNDAEPFAQKALQLMQRLLGEDHLGVANCYTSLASVYVYQGRHSDAEPLFQKALQLREHLLGEDHPDVAASYHYLANLYRFQGRYSDAEPLFQKALQLREHLLGEDHPDVAASYGDLALLYHSQGRYSDAEPLSQKVLQFRERLLGEDHPDVAASYNDLALLYHSQGRYSDAEPLSQKALQLRERLLGEDHPEVANSYNNLALLYYSQGRYNDAEPLYQKALQLRERLLREDHPNIANSYNNLAALYYSQGRYSDAEPLSQKALQIYQRLLREDHPDVINSYGNLALLYHSQGRYSDAEPLYQKVLELFEQQLGVGHPRTIICRQNYAVFLHDYAIFLRNKQSAS